MSSYLYAYYNQPVSFTIFLKTNQGVVIYKDKRNYYFEIYNCKRMKCFIKKSMITLNYEQFVKTLIIINVQLKIS